MTLQVWLEDQPAAELHVRGAGDGAVTLRYRPEWSRYLRAYPLSPRLPLPDGATRAARATRYLQHLLPGGPEEAGLVRRLHLPPDQPWPLLLASGDDLPGAIGLRDTRASRPFGLLQRPLPKQAIDERMHAPADAWLLLEAGDRQVLPWWPRLTTQDPHARPMLGVYADQGQWWWTRTPQLASTHLIEAPPRGAGGEAVLFNRLFCLRLAARLGLDVAPVELLRLPTPVLQFQRWDRWRLDDGRVRRLHAVSAAQVLEADGDEAKTPGMPRTSGAPGAPGAPSEPAAAGAPAAPAAPIEPAAPRASPAAGTPTWAQLAHLLAWSPQPLVDRRALLRWWMFQVLTGHLAAGADELWFFLDHAGLRVAPSMAFWCPSAAEASSGRRGQVERDTSSEEAEVAPTRAPPIVPPTTSARDWALVAKCCGAHPRTVANELRRLCEMAPLEANALVGELQDLVPTDISQAIAAVVEASAAQQARWVDDLLHTDHRDL